MTRDYQLKALFEGSVYYIPISSVIVSNTSATPCVGCFAVQVLSAAVISAATGTLTGFAGVTIPAGAIIYCELSSITLASGSVVLYKK